MSTPANAINEATTGICGFTGTAFTGSPMTQYQVVLGSATSSTLTQVSGTGTSGQVLTSNGAGSNPTWQNTSSPAPTPNTNVSLIDDFLVRNNSMFYSVGATSMDVTAVGTDGSHPGVFTNAGTFAASIGVGMGNGSTQYYQFFLGSGAISCNWVFKIGVLSDVTNTYTLRCGLADGNTAPTNGVFFTYTNGTNSGKYVGNTMNASVSSTANSNDTADTNWVNLGITVNAAGTSASFFVNGTEITNSPLATNIPTTTALKPFISCARTAGTGQINTLYADLCYVYQTLTSSR